jgi:hypothetical protein
VSKVSIAAISPPGVKIRRSEGGEIPAISP